MCGVIRNNIQVSVGISYFEGLWTPGCFWCKKLLDKFADCHYHEKVYIGIMAVMKRSTRTPPAERTVHRLKGRPGEAQRKVASEPEHSERAARPQPFRCSRAAPVKSPNEAGSTFR